MKSYFKFNLTGNKLFPFWLLLLVLCVGPYISVYFKAKEIQPGGDKSALLFILPMILLLFIVSFAVTFYIAKLFIESIEFKEQSFAFNGTIGRFTGVFLPGLLLCIITLGIYTPWFIKDVQKFFINNSLHDSNSLEFKGKGGELFAIFLVTLIIPIIILSGLMGIYTLLNHAQLSPTANGIFQVVTNFIMIPYMYFFYKWMVNIKYKEYNIAWKTDSWDSCGKIFVEMLLSVITIGLYAPMAVLRLYKYFIEKTEATSFDKVRKFGFDIEPWDDFLFLWGQILLMIITLGIYYPWAACKMVSRILAKTYSENIEVHNL